MRAAKILAGMVVLFSGFGCQIGDLGHWGDFEFKGPKKRVELTGALIQDPVSSNYVWVETKDFIVNNNEGVIKLPTNKRIVTPHIVKVEMEVFWGHVDQWFHALTGPSATSGGIADFAVLNSPGLTFYSGSGWFFVWGRWPAVRTNYVYIGSLGTTLYAEEMGTSELIVYDNGDEDTITLTCDPPAGSTALSTSDLPSSLMRGHYIIVDGCNVKAGPIDLNDPNCAASEPTCYDVQRRIKEAKEKAALAGYTP